MTCGFGGTFTRRRTRLPGVEREPRAWTDADVSHLLTAMLRAMKRASDPDADPAQPVALRGFSWIVNPFEAGGVVVAIEMSLGAAVAGPFDVPERDLNEKIQRVVDAARRAPTQARPSTPRRSLSSMSRPACGPIRPGSLRSADGQARGARQEAN